MPSVCPFLIFILSCLFSCPFNNFAPPQPSNIATTYLQGPSVPTKSGSSWPHLHAIPFLVFSSLLMLQGYYASCHMHNHLACIPPFHMYLLSTYYVLDTREITLTKARSLPAWILDFLSKRQKMDNKPFFKRSSNT